MKTSSLDLLKDPTVIVLAAGHGGEDSGASYKGYKESEQAIFITNCAAELLRAGGVMVEVSPHGEDTHESIEWVNKRYGFGDAWVIEFHRDSADGLEMDDASRRCGIYYGTSESSKSVGDFVRNNMVSNGAHEKSWSRPDSQSNFKRLGWIRKTRPAAHLLELGFIQGQNDEVHLRWLATVAAKAIFEAFTGHPLNV